jgi:predicted nucleotidyltransferase
VASIPEAVARLRAAAEDGSLDALCDRHQIDLMGIFGSAVRSEHPRDLDIAVRYVAGTSPDVLDFLDELSVLGDTSTIDLLDLGRAGPVARERGLVGGIPLYERNSGDFARAQMAATGERMDTDWLRRWDLELMARQPHR